MTYEYLLTTEGKSFTRKPVKFTTVRQDMAFKSFSFIAVSDVQIQDRFAVFQHWFKDHAKRRHPAFVINCGDIVNKPDPERVAVFFNLFRGLFSRVPVFSVIGNHDYGGDGSVLRD